MNLFVSGRLCLFGEHSDWAGYFTRTNSDLAPGAAIVSGIEQGIYAYVEKSENFRFRTVLNDGTQTDWMEYPLSIRILKDEARKGGFFSYVAGVAAFMLEYYDVGGVSIDCYKVTLPMKKGLSSSAAVCVTVARAFNIMYNLQISVRGEMEAAYRGEILTPSRCGRLDQACAYGEKPVLMKFDGENLDVERLSVGRSLYWVFADLKGEKDTKKILSSLNACYPYAQNEIAENVQKALGVLNQQIISETIDAFKKGDAETIGKLMNRAQTIFDTMVAPACPTELTSPKLHKIMNDPIVTSLALGAKGVGSQGDGTVQMICKSEADQQELVNYINNTLGLDAYPFTIKTQHSVKKAVIPLAGFGTRLFPATKIVDKAFLPVIDYDGIFKPAILVIMEELIRAGIEEIALIIQPEQQEEYDKLFKKDMKIQHYRHLPRDKRDYNVKIQQMGMMVTYIYQTEQRGFGHAVSQAKDFAGDDPVLMVLGDHLYHSNAPENCAAQMIEAYERTGMLTVSLDEVELERVGQYGIMTGDFIDDDQRLMQVEQMVEKPSADYANEFMGVRDKKGIKHYYCVFGQYILTPKVFEILDRNIRNNNGEGEIELTSVLDEIRSTNGMYAYLVDGDRYDIGIPEEYRRTMREYGIK